MKKSLILLLLALPSFALSASRAIAQTEDPLKPGLHDASEAGIVISTGNSAAQSYNLKQSNTYGWDENGLRFGGTYLDSSTKGTETTRFWSVGFRYERSLSERFGVYAGETLESDVFSGFRQRYNTDVGGKYYIFKEETFTWTGEAGFRHTIENQLDGQTDYNLLRFYTEAVRAFSKDVSTKLWVEYLPNLTTSEDYQVNGEASISATLSEIFSIKTAYLLKFRNLPPVGIEKRTDTWFTTSLVAKF